MADLIEKFFQEELTQAEEQALSDSLSSSTGEALRFGEKAQQTYLAFGLPDPQWPGGGPPSPPWSSTSLLLKPLIWAAVLLTSGLAVVLFWPHRSAAPLVPQASIPKMIPAPVSLKPQVAIHRQSSVPIPAAKPAPMVLLSTPVELTVHSHTVFSNLSVVVRRPSPGKVTVRVLNPDGTQALLLYDGPLQAGKWVFDWDGKLAKGQMAPPGVYRIQVESGPVVQNKNIIVR